MLKNIYKEEDKIKNRIKSLEQMLTEDVFEWDKIKLEKKLNKLRKIYLQHKKDIL